jgi:hypothetical protein
MTDLRQCYMAGFAKRADAYRNWLIKHAERNVWETQPGAKRPNLRGAAVSRQTEQLRSLRRENQGLGLSAKGNKSTVTAADLDPVVRANKVMRTTRAIKDASVMGGMAGGSLAGGAIGGAIGGLSPLAAAALARMMNPDMPMPEGLGGMMVRGATSGAVSGAAYGAATGGIAGGVNNQRRGSRTSNAVRGAGEGTLVGGLTGTGIGMLLPALSLGLSKLKGEALPADWGQQLAAAAARGGTTGALGGAALGGILGAARNPK